MSDEKTEKRIQLNEVLINETKNTKETLLQLQNAIDTKYAESAKIEFLQKLSHHKSIAGLLESRDKIIRNFSDEEWTRFLSTALNAFDGFLSLLPIVQEGEDTFYDYSILRFVKAEYLDDFQLRVVIELSPNPYVENLTLEKTFHLFHDSNQNTTILYKNDRVPCGLFEFFESDEEDLEVFDFFYEFYVNMVYFAYDGESD